MRVKQWAQCGAAGHGAAGRCHEIGEPWVGAVPPFDVRRVRGERRPGMGPPMSSEMARCERALYLEGG